MASTELERWVKERLTSSRFQHSLGVAKTARQLAERYLLDMNKCFQAGILHDIARDLSPAELLKETQAYGIVCDGLESRYPVLVHGRVGAAIVRKELGLTDPEILEAIELHTTGGYPLSPTAKVIFLADYIEPGRAFPGVAAPRTAALQGLDYGVAVAVQGIISYLVRERRAVHPKALELYNHYVVSEVIGS